MESTIRIEINKTTKKFRLVDITNYDLQGVALTTLSAKGLGTLRFAGNIVAQKLTTIDPLVNLATGATASAWFDCVLDSDGAIAYGIYSIDDYSVRTAISNVTCGSVIADSEGLGGFVLDDINLTNVLAAGDSITISNSLSANNGVKTITSVGLSTIDSILFVSQTVNAETPVASSKVSFDITKVTGAASGTYAGCEEIKLSVSFNADCERGLNGSIVVLDTTSYGDQEVVSKQLILMYPSWTNTPNFTSTDGAITLSAIATGTYTITSESTITLTNGDLLITYVASLSDEYRVSCSGSLCGLLPCIQNLLQVHGAAVKNGFSPYQYFVDSILLNYVQAIEYKKCGEFDKYQERVDAIESLLDASGCECSCCDNDALYWVINIDPEENNILVELQEEVAAIFVMLADLQNLITGTGGIDDQIAELAADITTNTNQIGLILNFISDLNTYVTTQFGLVNTSITEINADVAENTSDIAANTADIATNTTDIADSQIAIGIISSEQGVMNGQITVINGQISTINSNAASLTSTVAGLSTQFDTYFPVIQADIVDLQDAIFGTGGINDQIAALNLSVASLLSTRPLAYVATASQVGTSAPVLTAGVNQTGSSFTAARTGVGNYTLTSVVPFNMSETVVAQIATTNIFKRVTAYIESSTVIRIQTFDNVSGVAEDNILLDSKIHIQIYP
jgi:hypothetical protein